MIGSHSNLQAQNNIDCEKFCYAGGMACMRACTDTFKDEKKCGHICEYGDKVCTETCLDRRCQEECNKAQTSTEAKNCIKNCEEEGKPLFRGLLKSW
jgi:hypothetical protein